MKKETVELYTTNSKKNVDKDIIKASKTTHPIQFKGADRWAPSFLFWRMVSTNEPKKEKVKKEKSTNIVRFIFPIPFGGYVEGSSVILNSRSR